MIDKSNVQDIYTLSPSQEGILFHYILNPEDKSEYVIQLLLGIEGKLDLEIFESSTEALIKKYDILRSVFISEQVKKPVQVVLKKRETQVERQDLSGKTKEEQVRFVKEFMEHDRMKSFDLAEDLLIRFEIFGLGENHFQIVMSMHHIIIDGWSYNIIINDLFQIYKGKKNKEEFCKTKAIPYRAYIDWIKEQDTQAAETYWSQYLEDFEEQGHGGQVPVAYQKKEYDFILDKVLTAKLRELAVKWKVTVGTLVQTIWGVEYSKLNKRNDIIFGTVSSGRLNGLKDVEKMVGLLINTLPIRLKFELDDSFQTVAGNMQKHMFELVKYDYLPLNKVKSYVTNEDIFDNIIAFENYPLDLSRFTKEYGYGFDVTQYIVEERTNYPINIVVFPGEELQFRFIYNCNIFTKEHMKHYQIYYQRIAEQIIANPDILLRNIKLISEEEEQQILKRAYNDTDYVKGETVDDLIAKAASQYKDRTAIVFRNQSYTYGELVERIEKYAAGLLKITKGKRIIAGVMIERSIDTIVAMLAVVKAGMAYLPVEPTQPFLRVKDIITGSQAGLLITTKRDFDTCFEENVNYQQDVGGEKVFQIEEEKDIQLEFFEEFDFEQAEMPEKTQTRNNPEDLLYIIYTSGSTGKPKGAMVSHQNLVRLILNDPDPFQFSKEDVWSAFHSFCFDFSVWEMYGALLRGAKLYIVNKVETRDFALLHRAIEREKITVLSMTPTAFINFIQEDMNHEKTDFALRFVIFGGEVLHPAKLKEFQLKYSKVIFVNGYGVTETTVLSTYKMISLEDMALDINSIGTSLPTTSVYIMDQALNLLPDGVTGEVCIGGLGVGLGYLNRPDLTEARFVKNPYLDEMIYRSGDVGRYMENGEIEYFGRMDHQIKIRGFRIEIPEIEKNLMLYPDIREVVVLPIERHEVMSLAAFILSDKDLTIEKLRNFLQDKLPEYMVPSYFMVMDKFPMNNSGKADRNKLKEMNLQSNENTEKKAPVTEEERIMVEVWKEILEAKEVGIEDNFFYLGGDSIKAIQVASRLKKYGYKLVIKDLFNYPVIKVLSRYLKHADGTDIKKDVASDFGLLPIQTWFFENQKDSLNHYNQIMGLKRKKKLDVDLLNQVLNELVNNHDALRMTFQIGNPIDQTRQRVGEKTGDKNLLQETDLRSSHDFEADLDKILNEIQAQISIKENRLFLVALVHGNDEDFLYFVAHHLVVDGVSYRIIMQEVSDMYEALEQVKTMHIDKEEVSYQTWVEKINTYAQSSQIKNVQSYWGTIVEEGSARNLFCKDSGSMKQTDIVESVLSEMSTRQLLTDIHKAYNTEVKDIIVAALGMAFQDMSKQECLMVQIEGHGREELESDVNPGQTVGWFTTMYPFLINTGVLEDIPKYIKNVKEELRKVPNGGLSYGVLRHINKMWDAKDLSVPISFNYLGQFNKNFGKFEFADVKIVNSVSEHASRISEVGINCMVQDGKLQITVDYNKDLHTRVQIETYIEQFKKAIEIIIVHCLEIDGTQFTPHDFGNNDLSIDELEQLQNELGDIEL